MPEYKRVGSLLCAHSVCTTRYGPHTEETRKLHGFDLNPEEYQYGTEQRGSHGKDPKISQISCSRVQAGTITPLLLENMGELKRQKRE